MAYADFTYYHGTYMGAVSEEDFQRLSVRASSFLDYYTRNKAKEYVGLEELQMACCALVDKYKVIEAANDLAAKNLAASLSADGNELKSETVGGYSRTFASGGDSALSALNTSAGARKLLAETASQYLVNTGLLYRGGCPCTHPTR